MSDYVDAMRPEFERVTDGRFSRGDVAVFDQPNGVGTVGVVIAPTWPGDTLVDVFTQNPGPARVMTLMTRDLLGAWRLTAGAECKAIATEYARHRDLLPPDAINVEQETVKGYPITTYARRAGKRSFLARLADSVRGRK